jgi:hypothetical protein
MVCCIRAPGHYTGNSMPKDDAQIHVCEGRLIFCNHRWGSSYRSFHIHGWSAAALPAKVLRKDTCMRLGHNAECTHVLRNSSCRDSWRSLHGSPSPSNCLCISFSLSASLLLSSLWRGVLSLCYRARATTLPIHLACVHLLVLSIARRFWFLEIFGFFPFHAACLSFRYIWVTKIRALHNYQINWPRFCGLNRSESWFCLQLGGYCVHNKHKA